MKKTLSQYAQTENISYITAWRRFNKGEIKNAFKNENGIFIEELDQPARESVASLIPKNWQDLEVTVAAVQESKASNYRRNRSSTITRTDRYKNIEDGLVPFQYGKNFKTGNISIREAVILCQKAHYNIASFRNVIELMVEFCVNDIYFKGGNAKSREFFYALCKKIGIVSLQDKFFRENFRSGNTFIYRFDSKIKPEDIQKITHVFGQEDSLGATNIKLPVKYIILNPADIETSGSVNFLNPVYYKVLNPYEVSRLKNPQTDEDKELLSSLDSDTRDKINKSVMNSVVLMKLDSSQVYPIFYKKQDYEAFAIPMGFPVLEDINWKLELKKMDMAIARTAQKAILLVTTGESSANGGLGVNPKNVAALQEIFRNESISQVLVADFTTKATFVIPQIADILDPKKYEVVNEDIRLGLNNILIGDEKFANQSIKVDVFVELISQARETFLNEFLIPEIKRISKDLGFKNYPLPHYQKINIKNKLEYDKLYVRLAELGFLTAEETFDAIESDRLPLVEDSIESQNKFKALKDKELYAPIVLTKGKEDGAPSGPNGRPAGTKAPQSTKKVKPIGTKAGYSLASLTETMKLAENLSNEIEKQFIKDNKLKKLNDEQKELVNMFAAVIMRNENKENWIGSIKKYIDNPEDNNKDRINKIDEIAANHMTDEYLAILLHESQTN